MREKLAGVICIADEARSCMVLYYVRSAAEGGELRRNGIVPVLHCGWRRGYNKAWFRYQFPGKVFKATA